MNKKRLIITSLISIILVFILMIGSTYSVFTTSDIDENLNVYKTGNLDISYILSEDNIKITKIAPMNEQEAIREIKPYRITVENSGNIPYQFDLLLNNTTAGDTIDSHYLMIKVGELEAKSLVECTNNIIKEDIVVLPNESVSIDVRIWLSDKVSNDEFGKGFYGKLSVDGIAIADATSSSSNLTIQTTDFIETVMKQNAISDENIDFSKTSAETNTNGIYLRNGTKTKPYPIYYYRGNVDNNLIFADVCWKIVRTTETGGLKLIYNGTPNVNSSGTNCQNSGSSTVIGYKEFNSSGNSPAYVGYMYGNPFPTDTISIGSSDQYVYGNGVTYSNGVYTLTNTKTAAWSSVYESGLTNHHYTCFTTGTTCESVYYIYNTNSTKAYYLTLTEVNNIETALSEMLDNNTYSSTIKGNNTTEGTLDYWYYKNIEQKEYSSYIEDAIWCNDRSIYSLGGFNPNGGTTYIEGGDDDISRASLLHSFFEKFMSETPTPSLSCSRNVDRFTVSSSNGNGALDYPVGLLTADEILLAGIDNQGVSSNSDYLFANVTFWNGSPFFFYNSWAGVTYIYRYWSFGFNTVTSSVGVRPSISLKAGFNLTGNGDGSVTNPYVVE